MILVHSDIFSKIIFEEEKINVLVVENPTLFTKLVLDFNSQINGEDGSLILSSDDYKILNINKNIEFISQPALININDKRFINKLYSILKELSLDADNYNKTMELFSAVAQHVYKLCNYADFDIELDNEFDVVNLFKSVGLKFYDKDLCLAEKILDYILTVRDLIKINVFVIVNLKSYLDEHSIKQFEKSIIDHKINLLLLESHQSSKNEYEKMLIIDNDLCEI